MLRNSNLAHPFYEQACTQHHAGSLLSKCISVRYLEDSATGQRAVT